MIIKKKTNRLDLKYILSLLNSRLLSYWFIYTFGKLQRKTFPQFKVRELRTFPIKAIHLNKQKPLAILVEKILDFKRDALSVSENSDKYNKLEETIEIINKKIDQMVYKLYNLTPEEIKIVEKRTT